MDHSYQLEKQPTRAVKRGRIHIFLRVIRSKRWDHCFEIINAFNVVYCLSKTVGKSDDYVSI